MKSMKSKSSMVGIPEEEDELIEPLTISDAHNEHCECVFLTHAALLTSEGKLYTFGAGSSGRLGHLKPQNEPEPRLVEHLTDTLVSGACVASSHAAYLGDDGKVFTCGDGKSGKLGHSDANDQRVPKLVQSLTSTRIESVSVGTEHSVFLAASG